MEIGSPSPTHTLSTKAIQWSEDLGGEGGEGRREEKGMGDDMLYNLRASYKTSEYQLPWGLIMVIYTV